MAFLFEVGRVVATAAVAEYCTQSEFLMMLEDHRTGSYGKVPKEDAAENRRSLKTGARIMSVYPIRGRDVWLITEGTDDDGVRQSSTFLFPEEY